MQTQPYNDPNQTPDSRHEKINTLWKIISGIYVLAALGLSIFWMFDESGIPETICEWQMEIMDDGCYIALNLLGSLFALLVPLFVGKFIVEKVTGVKIDNPNYKK